MFKFVVLCTLVAAASALSTFGVSHLNRNAFAPSASHNVVRTHSSGDEAHAEVHSFQSDVRADGFQYAFDTTNGIHGAASGDVNGNMHGDFGWTSPEGLPVAVQYVADENGYQPNSDLLPTPPPVPAAIIKSLEYIRSHPAYVEHAHNYDHSASNNYVHQVAAPTTFVRRTVKNFNRHF